MRFCLSLLMMLTLTSCMTPEQSAQYQAQQEAQRQQAIEQQKAQIAALDAQEQDYCTRMGAPPKSPNYYDCRMRIEQALREQARFTPTVDDAAQAMGQTLFNGAPVSAQDVANARASGVPLQSNTVKCSSQPNYMGGMDTSCR